MSHTPATPPSGPMKIAKDQYLFREGDNPEAMYVVKSGTFAIVKTKNLNEIVLAEIKAGALVGEMAFFDNKPRSAGVKALKDSEVVALPYASLHAQFQNFPEWCKAIMKTINDSLRNANQRIKELEKAQPDEELFPPHTINKLISILNYVGLRYGKFSEEDKGHLVPPTLLRNYTIQVFQEATHKMQKLMAALSALNIMKVEELGEGRQKIVLFQPEVLFGFVDWYNTFLYKAEKDRVHLKEEDIRLLNALVHFGKKKEKNAEGKAKVNLTEIQNESMKEMGTLVRQEELTPLCDKKLIGEQMMETTGIHSLVHVDELEKMIPYWNIIFTLKRIAR